MLLITCISFFLCTNLQSAQQTQVMPPSIQVSAPRKALYRSVMRLALEQCSGMPRSIIDVCFGYVELEDPTPFVVCGLSKIFSSKAIPSYIDSKLVVDEDRVIAIVFYDLDKNELFDVTHENNVQKLPYILADCSDWPGSTFTCARSKISDGHRIWNARTGKLLTKKEHATLSSNGKNVLCCTNRGEEDYYYTVVDLDTNTILATINGQLKETANGFAVFCVTQQSKNGTYYYHYLVYDLDAPQEPIYQSELYDAYYDGSIIVPSGTGIFEDRAIRKKCYSVSIGHNRLISLQYMWGENAPPVLQKIDFSQNPAALASLTGTERLIYHQSNSPLHQLFRTFYLNHLSNVLQQYVVSATGDIYLFTIIRYFDANKFTSTTINIYKIDLARIKDLGSLDAAYLDQLKELLNALPCTMTEKQWKALDQLHEFDPVMHANVIRTYQLEKEAQARIKKNPQE